MNSTNNCETVRKGIIFLDDKPNSAANNKLSTSCKNVNIVQQTSWNELNNIRSIFSGASSASSNNIELHRYNKMILFIVTTKLKLKPSPVTRWKKKKFQSWTVCWTNTCWRFHPCIVKLCLNIMRSVTKDLKSTSFIVVFQQKPLLLPLFITNVLVSEVSHDSLEVVFECYKNCKGSQRKIREAVLQCCMGKDNTRS